MSAVLFDNDGVLIDSTAMVEASWRAFSDWYGIPADDLLEQVHGRRSRDVIAAYADKLPVAPDAAFERYIDACLKDFAMVDVLPGAVELLKSLPGRRYAIVTSGTRVVTEARMHGAGLPVPDVMITAADITHGKPHPMPYLVAAERLGVDPSTCLVVEDAPAGLVSGQAAGCKTLALLTTHERESLDGADLYAMDLSTVKVTTVGNVLRVFLTSG
ncbi:HAD-IA family hydrolase [Myceligenerans halotolerans]